MTPDTLDRLRAWLEADPVCNAHVIHMAFFHPERPEVIVDDPSEPKAVVVHHRQRSRLAMAATRKSSLVELLDTLPPGEYHLFSVDQGLMPAVEQAMDVQSRELAWLFSLRRQDFRPFKACETSPVTVDHAEMIARIWAPERDAYDYVRARIEQGPTAGVYVDRELVAWDMTHFETDKVVMMGFLHVKEPYRGRGYAKTVTTAMCEIVFEMGKIPACQVFEDNEPSLKLTESMGFRRLKLQVWGTAVKT